MNARAQNYSNYKSTNTIKYLIGITPSGGISFLSAGWGGKASYKLITFNSGFLDMLSPGDCPCRPWIFSRRRTRNWMRC